jgi:hypothetical protein
VTTHALYAKHPFNPDECQRRLRELSMVILNAPAGNFPYTTMVDACEDLAALVRSMDQWMSAGGTPPRKWRTKAAA